MESKSHAPKFLLMLPIGAFSGFLCAFLTIAGSLIFHFLFVRAEWRSDEIGLYFAYAFIVGIFTGAMLCIFLTTIENLILF